MVGGGPRGGGGVSCGDGGGGGGCRAVHKMADLRFGTFEDVAFGPGPGQVRIKNHCLRDQIISIPTFHRSAFIVGRRGLPLSAQ